MTHSAKPLLRKMADAAFDWAGARNLVRKSPIHGELEAKLVLEDSFAFKEEEGTARTENTRLDIEESSRQQLVFQGGCWTRLLKSTPNKFNFNSIYNLWVPSAYSTQDESGAVWDSSLPDLNSSAEHLLKIDEDGGRPEDGALIGSGSFKLLCKMMALDF